MRTNVVTQTIYLNDDQSRSEKITFKLDTCRDERKFLTVSVRIKDGYIEFPYLELQSVVSEFDDCIKGMGA